MHTPAVAPARTGTPVPAVRTSVVLTVLLAAVLAVMSSPFGEIVGRFGVSSSTASAIVAIITGAGGWALSVFFPWVIPYVLTIRGLIAVAGVGVATGW